MKTSTLEAKFNFENTLTQSNFESLENLKDIYLKDDKLRLSLMNEGLVITDISCAMHSARYCNFFSITSQNYKIILTWFLKRFKSDIKNLMIFLKEESNWNNSEDKNRMIVYYGKNKIIIDRVEIKAINIFSPLSITHIEPLTEFPEKIRKTHIVHLLANNQIDKVILRDEEGEKQTDALYALQDFIESIEDCAWTFKKVGGKIIMDCHSFLKQYTLDVNISKGFSEIKINDENNLVDSSQELDSVTKNKRKLGMVVKKTDRVLLKNGQRGAITKYSSNKDITIYSIDEQKETKITKDDIEKIIK